MLWVSRASFWGLLLWPSSPGFGLELEIYVIYVYLGGEAGRDSNDSKNGSRFQAKCK